MTFPDGLQAAEHYVALGEQRGLRPSRGFDPEFYRMTNPDLEILSSPLLLHFLEYGSREGRVPAFDADSVIVAGAMEFRPQDKTILLAVHEASRTGAPILGLNLARILSQTHNVVVVLPRGGELMEHFGTHAWRVLCQPENGVIDPALVLGWAVRAIHAERSLSAALLNSAESASLSGVCYRLGIPSVSLIHEFAQYVLPISKVGDMFALSNSIVFSSELTRTSALSVLGPQADRRDLHVFPQGKSIIPGSEDENGSQEYRDLLGEIADRFLCIGCGTLQIRKGVDLFVAAAAAAVREMGSERLFFLWVGDEVPGFDSIWLKDQVSRSGLQDILKIVPALSGRELEQLYRTAGAMFLSSRLDPFPNVAIDAVCAGLPIVCFEAASGIAEYLSRHESVRDLVVPYFDPAAAGRVLVRLATNPDYRRTVGAELAEMGHDFDIHAYVDRLVELMERAEDEALQEEEDTRVLQQSLIPLDPAPPPLPVSFAAAKPRDYVRLAASGIPGVDPRRPIPGFSPHIYRAQHPELGPGANSLADWLRRGKPSGPHIRDVLNLSGRRRSASGKSRVALQLHLHYPDLIEDILSRLEVNRSRSDLFVSTTSAQSAEFLAKRLVSYRKGAVDIRLVENRGRDVAPLLVEFASRLQDYDLIAHIHGKKSDTIARRSKSGSEFVDRWRTFLYENLLGDRCPALDNLVAAFEQDAKLGLAFPEDPHICGWGHNKSVAEKLQPRLGLKRLPDAIEFPVGNMFVARPKALKPLFAARFSIDDFPTEPIEADGTIMHAIERLLPIVCEEVRFSWRTTRVDGVTR